jgi:hypothetical protein
MNERGDIIVDGLLRMVAGLLLVGLLCFEVGAVAINQVQLDGKAQDAARVGAEVWDRHRDDELTRHAVEQEAGLLPDARVEAVTIEDPVVAVTVSRPAPVLVADRVWFLQDRIVGEATSQTRSRR